MKLNSNMLNKMSLLDCHEVNKDDLVDISQIEIDTSMPVTERLSSYLTQIKNPYYFRCGKIMVHLLFDEDGDNLESLLKQYFISLKQR